MSPPLVGRSATTSGISPTSSGAAVTATSWSPLSSRYSRATCSAISARRRGSRRAASGFQADQFVGEPRPRSPPGGAAEHADEQRDRGGRPTPIERARARTRSASGTGGGLGRRRGRASCGGLRRPQLAGSRRAASTARRLRRPAVARAGRRGREAGSDRRPCRLVEDVDLGLAQPGAVEQRRHVVAVELALARSARRRSRSVALAVLARSCGRRRRTPGRAAPRPAGAWRGRSSVARTGCSSSPPPRAVHDLVADVAAKRSRDPLLLLARAPRGPRCGPSGRSGPGPSRGSRPSAPRATVTPCDVAATPVVFWP